MKIGYHVLINGVTHYAVVADSPAEAMERVGLLLTEKLPGVAVWKIAVERTGEVYP